MVDTGLKGTAEIASKSVEIATTAAQLTVKAAGATAAGTAIGAGVVGAGNLATVAAATAGTAAIVTQALPLLEDLEERAQANKINGTAHYHTSVSSSGTNDNRAYTLTNIEKLSSSIHSNIEGIAKSMRDSGTVVISPDDDARAPILGGMSPNCLHKDASRNISRQFGISKSATR